jgi:Ca2+-binding EF-hand superfamily protein
LCPLPSQNKNAPKFSKLFEVFRDTDLDKRGRINRDGLLAAMNRLAVPVDPRVVDALMARCDDPASGMTLNDFRDHLWVDNKYLVNTCI